MLFRSSTNPGKILNGIFDSPLSSPFLHLLEILSGVFNRSHPLGLFHNSLENLQMDEGSSLTKTYGCNCCCFKSSHAVHFPCNLSKTLLWKVRYAATITFILLDHIQEYFMVPVV
uniref:Ovule protein n=1 Tax=Haemonchus contortus TaxID=6289 RepID=A0A7I5EEF1_HAECO